MPAGPGLRGLGLRGWGCALSSCCLRAVFHPFECFYYQKIVSFSCFNLRILLSLMKLLFLTKGLFKTKNHETYC